MKVILLQHVKGKGKKGDIIEVSDGYAQNALLPRGLAKVATAQEINKLQLAQQSVKIKQEKEKNEILSAFTLVNGKNIIIQEKINEKGSLYRAITNKEILNTLSEQYKVNFPESVLTDKYAFKETGDYSIELKAYNEKVNLLVTIQAQ